MRTAISESGRAVLEERIQTWLTLEDGQLEQVHMIALQLATSEDEVLDMLNVCANSRAALDRFGIEVYPEIAEEPKQAASPKLDYAGEADRAFDLELAEMWFCRFLIACAVVAFVVGVVNWVL
jgi:hypothetical protein